MSWQGNSLANLNRLQLERQSYCFTDVMSTLMIFFPSLIVGPEILLCPVKTGDKTFCCILQK